MSRLVILAALLILAASAGAGEIQKWVDEDGRVHFSNKGSETKEPPRQDGEGWESVIERKEGSDEFSRRIETALNAQQADRLRKKRERDRAADAVSSTQAEILRLQKNAATAAEIPDLQTRLQGEAVELRKLELELAQIETKIAKLKAMKEMGQEQAEKIGEQPLWQYGR